MQEEITALVLTFNEAPNIARTLRQLSWLRRVVLVDSFSTDDTADLARAAHPHVDLVQREFDSFAGQCNFGLTLTDTPWVLSLDADYVLSSELVAEISALHPAADVAGYSAEFRYCIFGRPLGATVYPARTVLYRRALSKYRDEGHGHRVVVEGKVERLSGKIDHDDRKPLSRWLQSLDGFSIREARHLLSTPREKLKPQDRLRRRLFFAPVLMFIYLLIVRGLIFNGWPGWYYVLQRTIAEMLLSLRLITERAKLEP
jgi:glycosyltransferase involved in cell wall biosynthesis